MIAYILTWTTYGTWLQGDEGGYVKDGKTYGANPRLYHANQTVLQQSPVQLSDWQRWLVKSQIYKEAGRIGQIIHAVTVQRRHVHMVAASTSERVGAAVHRYKRTATFILRQHGFMGKVWTRGYDKRYCYSQDDLNTRIAYVLRHDAEM